MKEINWNAIEDLSYDELLKMINDFNLYVDERFEVEENTSSNFDSAIGTATDLAMLIDEESVDIDTYTYGSWNVYSVEYFCWTGNELIMITEDKLFDFLKDHAEEREDDFVEFLEEYDNKFLYDDDEEEE